ncbi:imidazoleglycerol-phosphate dehydratase HisB [Thermovenabulum gondwanense]|uniref:Imidazoleglycerol-phosphate dehydratase n=1 Tax=Thermovenabulum gondwanense TaxID=520767 RepID=A0A162M6P9_9FIRM|nr:imidazoleglycerol-phosphate dehydratase HisB [Thermovenabulum gondwanense]KYO64329.1 Histidine biosynthesis bifunctional protein HisB [Thermovenabulum gondwanense]
MKDRMVKLIRKTGETDIKVFLNLDGKGFCKAGTGIGFFDHMLTQFALHGKLDLVVRAKGDLKVDDHHTVEDAGITLGKAVLKALKDKKGINRYGFALVPMDDALVLFSMDISGRPYLNFDVKFKREKIGDMSLETVSEFFRAFSTNAKVTLHVAKLYGNNEHHVVEAIFKAFGRALREAVKREDNGIIPSTKGVL